MDSAQLTWLTNFIWNIADDVLRDVFARGKYRDVILPMFEKPASVRKKLEKLVDDWGKDDAGEEDEEESGEETPRKTLPEKKKRKLLSAETWRRDAMLVDVATKLRKELGDKLFADHNVFLEKVDAALEKLDLSISAAER